MKRLILATVLSLFAAGLLAVTPVSSESPSSTRQMAGELGDVDPSGGGKPSDG